MPMHPHWQIKQINCIDGNMHVDHNNAFGGRASLNIWGAFNGMVMWILQNEKGVENTFTFNDDSFSISDASRLRHYAPYDQMYPSDQWELLTLWDELGIPHKKSKQLWGPVLVVIGIEVDINAMKFTLTAQSIIDLLAELDKFVTPKSNGKFRHFKRKSWQRLAGWLNWSFNVFPMLRPCLSNVYKKITEVKEDWKQIYCNADIRSNLEWAKSRILLSDGVFLLESMMWTERDADIIIESDACLEGLVFWYPKRNQAFYADIPDCLPADIGIFYLEALAIAFAIYGACSKSLTPQKILVKTDSSNAVSIFSTFNALPLYNKLLQTSIDAILDGSPQFRVIHIPGEQNVVADLLSQHKLLQLSQLFPQVVIKHFKPPSNYVGGCEKMMPWHRKSKQPNREPWT